jgi:Ala-tRNA(Pro) deacylase
MAVVPASLHVDLPQLKAVAGAKSAELASEAEFRERFADSETGAMPPFGNLYDVPVFPTRA